MSSGMGDGPASDDLIEDYLDDLLGRLAGRARAVRRMLADAEAHLIDAVAAGRAAGLDDEAAQRAAIERFGSPADVARRFARETPGASPLPAPVRGLAVAAVRLGGVGLVAVGASGLLAWLFDAVFGHRWLAGDPPGTAYSAARCADFFEYVPHARTCLAAAAAHHTGEVIDYRIAAGVLGVLLLVVTRLVARRRGVAVGLPRPLVPAVAATAFGVAAVALGAASADHAALGWSGVGQNLSGAVVAVVAAAWYAARVLRSLRSSHGSDIGQPVTAGRP